MDRQPDSASRRDTRIYIMAKHQLHVNLCIPGRSNVRTSITLALTFVDLFACGFGDQTKITRKRTQINRAFFIRHCLITRPTTITHIYFIAMSLLDSHKRQRQELKTARIVTGKKNIRKRGRKSENEHIDFFSNCFNPLICIMD